MSEREVNNDKTNDRNCLGHQFDPGSSTNGKYVEEAHVNNVEGYEAHGYRRLPSFREDDNVNSDVFPNGSNGVDSHKNLQFDKVLNKESDSLLEGTLNNFQNGYIKDENAYAMSCSLSSNIKNGDTVVKPKQNITKNKLQSTLKATLHNVYPDFSVLCDLPSTNLIQRSNRSLHNIGAQPGIPQQTVIQMEQGHAYDIPPISNIYQPDVRNNHRPQTLFLARSHNENSRQVHSNFEQDELDLLVDEGAVCDYDKFLLSDEHNSPSENSRSEEGDSEYMNYHFPDTQLDCMAIDGSILSEHKQFFPESIRDVRERPHENKSNSPKCEVDFDDSDYLKLFDEADGECYSGGEENEHETFEDTGDFIDTDLPAQSMLSSTSSTSSLSDEGLYGDIHIQDSKENDLSRNKLNFVTRSIGEHRINGHAKIKGNLCFPADAFCASYRQPCGLNSSESENGDDYANCDVTNMCCEDDPLELAAAASSRNIHLGRFYNGAGGGQCLNYPANSARSRSGCFHNGEHPSGSVDCGSAVALPTDECSVPSGSASVNGRDSQSPMNLESNSIGACRVRVSNFQNDMSNNQQKVFVKFNVTNQDRKRTLRHIKRDASHLSSPEEMESSHMDAAEVGVFQSHVSQQWVEEQMMVLAAEMARTRVNAESGVSEPIYEDLEPLHDIHETGNMASSALPLGDHKIGCESLSRKPLMRVVSRRRDQRSSSGGRSGVEKVMIWNEYEAYVLQVKQIATSACGPTAVLNVLKAFDVCIDKEEVCRRIHTNLRDELGSIPKYLCSRAIAGTTAEDLLQGIESLTDGRIRGRFFHFWPVRDVALLHWLGQWMKKGAVPLATLNLQEGVKCGWTIPDAWHHQMVYGVSSKGLYLTNPLENVTEETVLEQLVSESVLLVRRQDVVSRFRDDTDLGELIRQADPRWRELNVLGQVVNVLRESNMPHPMYRAQLTSHISIPAVYKAGVTLFVQADSDLWEELQAVPDLPIKDVAVPDLSIKDVTVPDIPLKDVSPSNS